MHLKDRFQNAWNAFRNRDPTTEFTEPYIGSVSSYRPDRMRFTKGTDRTIVSAVLNRIAMDCAAIQIQHVRLDDNGRYMSTIDSGLNNCLTLDANRDQTGRAFIQDVVMSMLDEGCVAIVPVDTDIDITKSSSVNILTLRTGKIIEWYPYQVRVRVYNENSGEKEDILLPKGSIGIVENPLYATLNEPNSTMQRLIRKLTLMDAVDEQTGSGKLDLIIQLPYTVKTDTRRQQAENRRKDIEMQLTGSKYGIAYIDSTEKITQLNRSLENNLLKSVEYLTNLLYSQLGITSEILNGTADEKAMLNYNNRVIEPIMSAITDEIKRKFLTKTARSQKQSIMFFRDPFKLVPVDNMAEIADKFTRNEIMTSNEIRQIIGMKPAADPNADQLRNKNLSQSSADITNQNGIATEGTEVEEETEEENNEETSDDVTAEVANLTPEQFGEAFKQLDEYDKQYDELEKELENLDDDDTEEEESEEPLDDDDDDKDKNLKHYASPYYDPVKAHEYYMRTRELKGTSGLSTSGKEAATYIKKQLYAERDKKIEESKTDRDTKLESLQSEKESKVESLRSEKEQKVESYKTEMNNKITALKNKLSNMTTAQKKRRKDDIYAEIAKLREDNQTERKRLTAELKSTTTELSTKLKTDKTSVRDAHTANVTALKEEYEQKYTDEMAKLREDSSMLKTSSKKSSSKSSSKKSSSSSSSSSSDGKKIIYYSGKSRRQQAQEKYGKK